MILLDNIEKYSKINRERLSQEFYFKSLLLEAYEQAELSDAELENIQMQCLRLLADSTERYSRGQSSSVRVEAAQAIMASNFYTIGLYLKSMLELSSALDALKQEPIANMYEQGCRILKRKLHVARYLYLLVIKTKIQTPNYSYNATIDEGIKSFFQDYNSDYEAHETPALIDYQLANPVTGWAGVEYMIHYLNNLYMENLFCARFDNTVIHEVMLCCHKDYKDLLINIFEQVLHKALGRALLDKDILSLSLEPSDIRELKYILQNRSKDSVYSLLQRAADIVINNLSITKESLKPYIYAVLPELTTRLYHAGKQGDGSLASPSQ